MFHEYQHGLVSAWVSTSMGQYQHGLVPAWACGSRVSFDVKKKTWAFVTLYKGYYQQYELDAHVRTSWAEGTDHRVQAFELNSLLPSEDGARVTEDGTILMPLQMCTKKAKDIALARTDPVEFRPLAANVKSVSEDFVLQFLKLPQASCYVSPESMSSRARARWMDLYADRLETNGREVILVADGQSVDKENSEKLVVSLDQIVVAPIRKVVQSQGFIRLVSRTSTKKVDLYNLVKGHYHEYHLPNIFL